MAPVIRPVTSTTRFAGLAFTLRTLPGDNLGVFHALKAISRNHVLIIDAGGTERVTIWGGSSTIAAKQRGVAACVTNGAVRDIDEINASGFPVFAAGVSVRGAAKNHPGWIGSAVSVGDVVVSPGDLVVGDSDGVVVVEKSRMREVVLKACERMKDEDARDGRLRSGECVSSVFNI